MVLIMVLIEVFING